MTHCIGEHLHQLEEENARLEKENMRLRSLLRGALTGFLLETLTNEMARKILEETRPR